MNYSGVTFSNMQFIMPKIDVNYSKETGTVDVESIDLTLYMSEYYLIFGLTELGDIVIPSWYTFSQQLSIIVTIFNSSRDTPTQFYFLNKKGGRMTPHWNGKSIFKKCITSTVLS